MERSIKLFVPLGTQKFPFGRLITVLNDLVDKGLYQADEIVMQAATYPIVPNFQHHTILPQAEFMHLIEKAEVVVTHSGVNTIIATMNRNRPLVVVPRLKEYGEHVDDHQLEIADIMEEKFDVTVITDLSQLPAAIEKAKHHHYKPWVSHTTELVDYIKSIINSDK